MLYTSKIKKKEKIKKKNNNFYTYKIEKKWFIKKKP